MTRASIAALLIACLPAGAALANEVEDAATAAAETAASLALNPLAALDKSSLDGLRDAPLFTPSRTRPAPPPPVAEAPPPPAPPEPEPEPPADPPTLTLAGIAQGPEGAVAFVAKEGEKVEQVRLGDDIDGWLVTSIEPESLKLTLDEREQEYRMFVRPEKDAASSDESSSDEDSSSSSDEEQSSSDEDEQKAAQRRAARDQQRQRANRLAPQKPQGKPPHSQNEHNRAQQQPDQQQQGQGQEQE